MTSRKYWPAASSIASSSFISVTWAADEMLVFEWMGGTILTYRIAGELPTDYTEKPRGCQKEAISDA
jgi:hypothetical protein